MLLSMGKVAALKCCQLCTEYIAIATLNEGPFKGQIMFACGMKVRRFQVNKLFSMIKPHETDKSKKS